MHPALSSPAVYFPLAHGRYEVAAGLKPLGTDFGHGARDHHVFQFDDQFALYRGAKQEARRERLSKYFQTQRFEPPVAQAVTAWILDRLVHEHPALFNRTVTDQQTLLTCTLTGETLRFDRELTLGTPSSYSSALDALAMQIQEDMAVVRLGTDCPHFLSAVHLCFPNHWAAEEKIGRDFALIHQPVPGMTKLNQAGADLMQTLINRGPFVRFAWGLATDSWLNHHPEPPPTIDPRLWQGRAFDPLNPQLYLRIERQVLWGLPHVGALIFTIRTYFRPVSQLDLHSHGLLYQALASMSPEAQVYKGVAGTLPEILHFLSP